MLVFQLLFISACIYAAVSDFLIYKIPNWIVLFLLLTFLVKAGVLILMGAELNYFFYPLISFVSVLVIGFLLFATGVFGAGDAKFLAVCALWMGEINTMQFILLTVVAGGGLAFIYLTLNQGVDFFRNMLLAKIVDKNVVAAAPTITTNAVPYGVAIAIGAIWVLAIHGWH